MGSLRKFLNLSTNSLVIVLIISFQFLFPSTLAWFPDIYDFVVVGGGTAGSVVATRLSEGGKHSVLVLESGGVPHPDQEVPALSSRYWTNPQYVKMYQTVPQRNAGLVTNGIRNVIVPKTLGGGASINNMLWNRGHPEDFNTWANLTGDPSWTYSSMLDYFKKAENYSGAFPSSQHGTTGPISVSQPHYAPCREEWLLAGQQLGYPVGDPNGPQRISYAPLEFTKRRGRRSSAYLDYLKPAMMSRKNLHVMTNAEVVQIIFRGKRALGVRYRTRASGNETYFERVAVARNEVILSAGAIESPVLLLRSGIGPKETLHGAGIRPVRLLPGVGFNLQDHVMLPLVFNLNNGSAVFDPSRDLTTEAMTTFNSRGDGPYSSNNGGVAQAFLKSSVGGGENSSTSWPDTLIIFTNSPVGVPFVLQTAFNSSLSALKEEGHVPTAVWILVARPASRGRITLNKDYPEKSPLIDFQYLTHPDDKRIMMDGITAAINTFEKTASFQKLGARLHPEAFPPCAGLTFRSEDYWSCYIGQLATFGGHVSSSLRMGRGSRSDRDAVVDPMLRVIGVDRLRVVDASVMPSITNTNIQAAVYAIAEKAADMIRQSWG